MDEKLENRLPGVNWNFSQNIRDNVMESLSGVKGDNSLKIFGPDFNELQDLALKVEEYHGEVPGLEDVGVFNVHGAIAPGISARPGEMRSDGACRWPTSTTWSATALGGQAVTQMVEGEKKFDISIRWPEKLRDSEESILEIPVNVGNNTVVQTSRTGLRAVGNRHRTRRAAVAGTLAATANPLSNTPQVPLRELVSAVGEDGASIPAAIM